MRLSPSVCLPALLLLSGGASFCLAAADEETQAGAELNRRAVAILSEKCFTCHGPDAAAREADLRFDRRTDAIADIGGYAAIHPGKPDDSELIVRIESDDPYDMMPPPEAKNAVTAEEQGVLRRWIAAGAEYEIHWAFRPPQRVAPPAVRHGAFVRGDIDRFILARLQAADIKPNPPAVPARLVRRLYLDLIGLPPTPEQVQAFTADPSDAAYTQLVDELLASPRYGEKWARQWLDLARYADSNGYQRDGFRDVWAYRDWVIRALNGDLTYDQFIIEQIAGDLLPDATRAQRIATGFHRQPPINLEAGTIPEADRVNQVVDRVNTTGTAVLGLTIECAQCHSHKYDPISQEEYYRLFAYFNNTPLESRYRNNDKASLEFTEGPAVTLAGSQAEVARREELQRQHSALLAACAETPTPEQKKALAALKKKIDAIEVQTSLVMQELPKPRPTHVMTRGQWDQPGKAVEPGVLSVLNALPEDAPPNRLGLAHWLAAEENPLTARAAVNRWWLEIFGQGLVDTPEDFGIQGEPPSHPALLDYLACELMEHGWSMKHVVRQIVLSGTYRQSSRTTPEQLELDPQNRLLGRGPRFRLPAEAVRDNALAVAGLLSDKMYGPPVRPPQPPKVWRVTGNVDNTYRTSKGEDRYRRGIYTIWRRSAHYPSFANFDAPSRGACVVKRSRTNTPLQALTLLNDSVYAEAAAALATRIMEELPEAEPAARIDRALRLCVAREPRPAEIERLTAAFAELLQAYRSRSPKELPAGTNGAEHAAWTAIARILLNLDETMTKG
jgi:hypothetical protein